MTNPPFSPKDITQNIYNHLYKAIQVIIQDQYTEIIDLYMCRQTGSTNPSAITPIDSKTITVDSTTGATLFDCINIIENSRVYQGLITDITGNVITMTAPTDQEFTTNATIIFGEWNMNYNGSVTPLIYNVQPPAGVKWDVTRIIIGMTDDNAMDDGKFGGIPSLSNGVVLRVKNGVSKNIFNVSDNGGFRERSFDVEYVDATLGPAGLYGFGCRRTFGGQSKNGVVIRLDGDEGDQLQMIIQDDLTDLSKLAVVVQGHVVD